MNEKTLTKVNPEIPLDLEEWNFPKANTIMDDLKVAFRKSIGSAIEASMETADCTFAKDWYDEEEKLYKRHPAELHLDLGFDDNFSYRYRFDLRSAVDLLVVTLSDGPEEISQAREVAAGLLELHNTLIEEAERAEIIAGGAG